MFINSFLCRSETCKFVQSSTRFSGIWHRTPVKIQHCSLFRPYWCLSLSSHELSQFSLPDMKWMTHHFPWKRPLFTFNACKHSAVIRQVLNNQRFLRCRRKIWRSSRTAPPSESPSETRCSQCRTCQRAEGHGGFIYRPFTHCRHSENFINKKIQNIKIIQLQTKQKKENDETSGMGDVYWMQVLMQSQRVLFIKYK